VQQENPPAVAYATDKSPEEIKDERGSMFRQNKRIRDKRVGETDTAIFGVLVWSD